MHLNDPVILQFIKYVLAGGLATVTHISLFHLFGWKIFPALQKKDHFVRFFKMPIVPINDATRARNAMICNYIAFIVSNMVAYIANVLWVFQGGKYHVIIEILLFYAVSGISTYLGTLLMIALIKRFGILTTYAFGGNMLTAVMINYSLRKFFIFSS
jgi:putative flippase GtrA